MLRLIFYPGVIMHEFSHAIACLFTGTKISKISFGLKESYVKHDAVGPIRMSLIALAPFFLGLIMGGLLFYLARINITNLIIFIIFNYLGVCILYNSIPSNQDTKNIYKALQIQIKKDWKKSFSHKLLVILKIVFIYSPIFLFGQIVRGFDKYDLVRTIYVIFVFALVYGLL